jgi:colanic acid/amylovoran biosynthesis glycosyltransferase
MSRVVIVVSTFPKLSENFIVNKILGLLKEGLDVQIVCSEFSPAGLSSFEELNNPQFTSRIHQVMPSRSRLLSVLMVPHILLTCLLKNPISSLKYFLHWIKSNPLDKRSITELFFSSQIIKLNPSIVHFEFGTLARNRMYLKEILKSKMVVSFRGYDLNFSGLGDREFFSDIWEKADRLHFLGEDLYKRAIRRGCSTTASHSFIAPAIDSKLFSPPNDRRHSVIGSESNPIKLLSVGRMEWKKGYRYALEALKILKEKGYHFEYTIIGDGDHLESIAFARHQLGLESNVHLVTPTGREQVKLALEKADIFLHPAISEGFCNAVIEAQSMSVPVICSDAGGLRENVIDQKTGFVVPCRDPHTIFEKIMVLANDPVLRKQMGNAGRTRVLEHFTLDKQIESFRKMYISLLSGKSTTENKVNVDRSVLKWRS